MNQAINSANLTRHISYVPSFGLKNSHAQTILSSMGPRKGLVKRQFSKYQESTQLITLDGGNGVRLQGYLNQAGEQASERLVILLHGWEGSHESVYIRSLAFHCLEQGIDTFRLNLRDHGDSHHLNEEIFNSTFIDEVVSGVKDFQDRYPYKKRYMVGFSLGGNFSCRVAAFGNSKGVELDKVIAFCPVINPVESNAAIIKGPWIYEKYFARKWKRSLRKKHQHWPGLGLGGYLNQVNSLRSMNEILVPKFTGFDVVDDYFAAYAISGDVMRETVCPCYLHFAADDSIIPIQAVSELASNPKLDITITDRGGHCGYIDNWKWDCWQDSRTLELILTD